MRHFITFKTILETGSYTSAAARLGYTQSTMTSHIQALEKGLGGPLFHYSQKKLQLTIIGERALPLVNELLTTYQHLTNLKTKREVSGELRIAAPESLTIYRLGPILRQFTQRYPNVKLILSNGTCSKNQKEVVDDVVDIGFALLPKVKQDHLIEYCLQREQIVLVTSKMRSSQFGDYTKAKNDDYFVTNESACSYRVMFEKHMETTYGAKFNTMELWSIEAIKKSILGGLGFSFLPYITVKKEIEKGHLQLINHEEQFDNIYAYMMVKSKKWRSLAAEKFMEMTMERSETW